MNAERRNSGFMSRITHSSSSKLPSSELPSDLNTIHKHLSEEGQPETFFTSAGTYSVTPRQRSHTFTDSRQSSDIKLETGKQRKSSASVEGGSSSASGSRSGLFKRIRRTSMSIKNILQNAHASSRSTREIGSNTSRNVSFATEMHADPSWSIAGDIANRCRSAQYSNQQSQNPFDLAPQAFYSMRGGGDAARASAAAASASHEFYATKHRNDSNITLGRASTDNRESGLGVGETRDEGHLRRNSHLYRIDPLTCLPSELASLIFQNLDVTSLARASRVSKRWADAAADQHVWRSAFLNRFEPKPRSCPLPLTVGGSGTGKPKLYHQDWKNMYNARTNLEANWAKGNAMAIYLNGHTDSVYCVQYNEDIIITGSRDRTFRVWDINTYECIKVVGIPSARDTDRRELGNNLPHPPLLPTDHVVHPNPARELPASVYHVPQYYHDASILCLQFDDEIMVTGSSDCTLIIWDIRTWEPLHRLRGHTAGVLDIAFDKEKIVSCSKDATLCVWDRDTGHLLQRITGHMGPVNAVQLRGQLVISASGEGCARLWNLGYDRQRRRSSVGGGFLEEGRPTCAAKCVKEFWSKDRGLACVEFSDDAKYVLAGGNDQVIYKFDTQTGKRMEYGKGHENLVRSLYLDEANRRVVSGSYDSSLRVWDYETGEMTMCFPHWTSSWMLSAKSDYRRIVCTSQDGRALILDFGWGVEGVKLLRGR